MFANKENVNILTSLIKKSEIRNAVVCPGSRNAPIVNNLYNLDDIDCHPVTDERSAGFYALGLALATGQPVVVCVTSGSALLNVLPAVAEAYYQKVPMLVVSADRPVEWIGQNDGQTLPQADALHPFVVKKIDKIKNKFSYEIQRIIVFVFPIVTLVDFILSSIKYLKI